MSSNVINACGAKGNVNEVKKLWNNFSNDAYIKKHMPEENREEAFVHLLESELNMALEDVDYFNISKGQFRGVKNKINSVSKAIRKGKLAGGVTEMLYTSAAIANRNPEVKGMLERFIHISHSLKGRQQKHSTMYNNVISYIRKEAIARGYEKESIVSGVTAALRGKTVKAKADKLENDIMAATADYVNRKPGGQQKLKELKALEDKFYREEEGKIFSELLHHIEVSVPEMYAKLESEGVKNIKIEDYIKDFKDAEGNRITSHGMQQAVKEHLKIIDETWNTLDQGVKTFIDSIMLGLENTTSKQGLEAIKEKLTAIMSPNKVKGYYPHYSRDLNTGFIEGLMHHLENVNQATSLTLSGHDSKTAASSLSDLNKYIDKVGEGYLSGHAQGRVDSKEYSRNYLTVMKNYVDEVNRFNFIDNSNQAARKAINTTKDVWAKGEDMQGYGLSVVKYMQDLHSAQTGVRAVTNPKMDSAMRTLLGMEFVSKLGWNLRSGLRNLTQSVLNYVQFGFTANRKADAYIDGLPLDIGKTHGDRTSIQKDMEGAGFLFNENAPQLEETLGVRGGMHKVLRMNENTGKLDFVPVGKVEKASAAVSKVAGKSAVIMQKVENYNRSRTYKTGFATMHSKLTDNQAYRDALMDGSYDGKKRSAEQVDSYVWNKSRNYAINMVNMLHFDYGDVSKAKALRTPLGKIIGQFQHYGFKFAELNANIFSGAKNDIMSGSMTGADALKAYRMAMIYFLAPVLAAGLTGLDFSNLLEHDTKQRIVQIATALTGDGKDIEEATYGRGITAMVGGPLVSDMLAIGNIMGFVDLDKNELNNFLVGYQRQADLDSDEKSAQMMRIFSTALSRGYNSTIPLAMAGNIGFAAQLESGIVSTKESRKIRKKAQASVPNILSTKDKDIMNALDLLQGTSKKKVPYIY